MRILGRVLVGLAFGFLAFAEANDPPQRLYGPLYKAVEQARIFDDGKEFADAIAKSPPRAIMAAYGKAKPRSATALKAFVEAHFLMPEHAAVTPGAADTRPLRAHIDALWPQLVRQTSSAPRYSSLLALPYPYVVPGGRFRELYYWDSYFTMLGLAESGRGDLVDGMVRNFAHLIDVYGRIPNGTRSYYLSRSQPPFFFAMAALTTPDDPAKAYARYLPELKAEYRFWMLGAQGLPPGTARARAVALPNGAVLNRYWDDSDLPRDESFREDERLAKTVPRPPGETYRNVRAAAESGWDFSARWLSGGTALSAIATTQFIPVDLNSLLFGLENAIRQGCERRRDTACVQDFSRRARQRQAAIDRYLWDGTKGFYFDYRWPQARRSEVVSAASFYPLFVGLADPRQARAVADHAGKALLKPGGLVTTPIETGQQWDAPNGWAPLQWIAVAGLRRYDEALAATIACRWVVTVNAEYRSSGKLVEKYDVVRPNRSGGGGEYPLQDGFGWTNGGTRKFLALYPATAAYTTADQCGNARRP